MLWLPRKVVDNITRKDVEERPDLIVNPDLHI